MKVYKIRSKVDLKEQALEEIFENFFRKDMGIPLRDFFQ